LMHNAGERLKELIEKFLVFAQVELTAANPEFRKGMNLAPHFTKETISEAAERVAHERNRSADLKISLESVEHRISPLHLDRIVRELVENAFKFSEQNSPVEVRSTARNGSFQVEIADCGIGIATEQIQRIGANMQFDRRLHEQQGSGLGLSIARRLTELYGGTLSIQSNPGERTVVSVEFSK
jgi:two-component system, sensor histidine kinase and response regulator